MGVNIGSIMEKVTRYANSPAGKQKIAQTVQSIREGKSVSGSPGRTQAGDTVVTYNQMQDAAKELISIIRRHAASANLPASVMAHVESFCDSPVVVNPDGSASISISMTDDPRRPSLVPEEFDGLENIVAAFNVGISAKGVVYGMWESHGVETWSRKNRGAIWFMQSAINEFNSKYGDKYNVTVTLDNKYEKPD